MNFIRKTAIEWVAELSPNPLASDLWNALPEDIRNDRQETLLSVLLFHAEVNTQDSKWTALRLSVSLTERLYWSKANQRPPDFLTPEKFVNKFEADIW